MRRVVLSNLVCSPLPRVVVSPRPGIAQSSGGPGIPIPIPGRPGISQSLGYPASVGSPVLRSEAPILVCGPIPKNTKNAITAMSLLSNTNLNTLGVAYGDYPRVVDPEDPEDILLEDEVYPEPIEVQEPDVDPIEPLILDPFEVTGPEPEEFEPVDVPSLDCEDICACVAEHCPSGGFVEPFDKMLIRYSWNANGGRDLDTRTALIAIPDASVSGEDVGWARADAINGSSDRALLIWVRDNRTDYGPETVGVNFSQIMADYPDVSVIRIRIRAFWYNRKDSGNFNITFYTYQGGTFVQEGTYDLFVEGGVLQQQVGPIYSNTQLVQAWNLDGEDIGTVMYDTTTQVASWVPI